METETKVEANAAAGLTELMQPDKYLGHLDQCGEYCLTKVGHPFGLDTPPREPGMGRVQIRFVGGHGTDTTVNVFLANIRFWVGATDERRVKKLRVITVPFPKGQKGQHYVFFEVQTSYEVIISGETTDFSGGGNAARQTLEDVLALLSQVYEIKIERTELTKAPSLQSLYND